MRLGVLQQCAPPQELYDNPANVFVAAFIGSPSMNLFESRIEGAPGSAFLKFGDNDVACPPLLFDRLAKLGDHLNQNLAIGLRPDVFVPPEQVPKISAFPPRSAT